MQGDLVTTCELSQYGLPSDFGGRTSVESHERYERDGSYKGRYANDDTGESRVTPKMLGVLIRGRDNNEERYLYEPVSVIPKALQ